MILKEYLDKNNVAFDLWKDVTQNIENVIGKEVYICDYRVGDDVFGKPIRHVEPKKVMVLDAKDAKKNIYYSPVFFREVSTDGKLLKQEIAPYDNTGFRGRTGTSVNIFSSMESCVSFYIKQLENAKKEYKAALKKLEQTYIEKCVFVDGQKNKHLQK